MTLGMILKTLFEFALIVGTLWAVLHEDKFAAAEARFFARLRRRKFKVVKGGSQYSVRPLRDR
ncbi:MAG: hypothetical protein MJ132_00415 [Clostridia bacterium]|nr:hypothetical protein [Clostridia bacterium]